MPEKVTEIEDIGDLKEELSDKATDLWQTDVGQNLKKDLSDEMEGEVEENIEDCATKELDEVVDGVKFTTFQDCVEYVTAGLSEAFEELWKTE